MERFKNILVLSREGAGDKTTIDRAMALAARNQARLTVVDVIAELPKDVRRLVTVMTPNDLQDLVIEERREQLRRFVVPMLREGVRVNIDVLVGSRFVQIIREVLRNGHDLVIMTANCNAGVKARLLGSTSLDLLRKCPCPVWIVDPAHSTRYSQIMAAVDPDTSDEERNQVNTEIMDLAMSLARLEDSELHVVLACPAWEGKYLRKQEMVEEVARQVLTARMKQIDELLGSYSLEGLRYQVHLLKGDPGILISQVVARQRVDLIVMGTVSPTGLAGLFFGNTAETVLRHVDCSVLAVPKRVASPVEREDASLPQLAE